LHRSEAKAEIESFGGVEAVVEDAVHAVHKAMRGTTMHFNRPYVFSMCVPLDERVRNNGLLSQWRGYGRDGGYAIVFDPADFEELLAQEAAEFAYQYLSLGDVFYYGESSDQPAMEEVREAESTIESVAEKMFGPQGNPEVVSEMYVPVTMLSTLFKHWGFAEEREVRVVAIPLHHDSTEEASEAFVGKQRKIEHFLPKEGLLVPYIELFRRKVGGNKLPIRKLIVGPHSEKEKRLHSARSMLEANGYDVPVVASEIPYLGR